MGYVTEQLTRDLTRDIHARQFYRTVFTTFRCHCPVPRDTRVCSKSGMRGAPASNQ